MGKFDIEYQYSMEDREGFWAKAAEEIDWIMPWDKVLDISRAPDFYSWFSGATCNTCYNALDRHVKNGKADQTAIIYDSPITNVKKQFTYQELLDQVALCAGMLKDFGVGKGDVVILYMPMIPEAAIGMLACARIGAVHSVVFGGFAPNELATRILDCKPKVILSASCGIEPGRVIAYKSILDEALMIAPNIVEKIVIVQREQQKCDLIKGRDIDWYEGCAKAKPAACVAVKATDPLYILYTSGTTGQPKGVIRDNGGNMVALHWSMGNIYNVEAGEVFWAASDVGWVVGHSYIVYGPLLKGCTTVLFEGKPIGTPDAGTFWRVIEEYGVTTLFTAPTAFRAIRKEDPNGEFIKKYDLSKFRALFLAGERCDPDTLFWAQDMLKIPVIDHWWQTETGWPVAANCLGIEALPIKPGSPTKAVPGYDIRVLTLEGDEVPRGEMGAICIKLPLPPGCLPTLHNADDRFLESYMREFPSFYETGDAGYMDADGYLYVMSRTDDIINVAGHRLSTGGMEEVLAAHPDVAECAVLGVADKLKGQLPMGFLVLKSGVDRSHDDICKETIKLVREKIGPVAAFKLVSVVKRLPKTRSGKILRSTIAKIADGVDYKIPATIDDPIILNEITTDLGKIGYPMEK